MSAPRKDRTMRARVIRRLGTQLERQYYPRLAMLAVLALGGLAGFLTSAWLLQAGVRSMPWRYGIGALIGYAVFLLGLRLWLTVHGRRRLELGDALDAGNLPTPSAEPEFVFGGSGGFSGGGAGGSLTSGGLSDSASAVEAASGAADAADALSGLEDGAVVVIPALIIGAIVVGLAGVVTVLLGAPGLLAELLLDGVIAGAAYRRLRLVPVQHWLEGAVRRTWKPMLALTLTLVAAGWVAQAVMPNAHSIGDLMQR